MGWSGIINGMLAVHGGRILYVSGAEAPDQVAARIWDEFRSISTEGGEPRRERMPFLNPEYSSFLFPADSRHGVILILSGVLESPRGELWLAGFDGSRPRRIGEAAGDGAYSVSPDLKTLLRVAQEGLFARPVDGGLERLLVRIDWNTPSYTFWHPSGKRVGFLLLKDGPSTIWEVRRDGTGLRPLLPEFQAEQVCRQLVARREEVVLRLPGGDLRAREPALARLDEEARTAAFDGRFGPLLHPL